MSAIAKLTHYGSGNPTLVNLDDVKISYRVWDEKQGNRENTLMIFKDGDRVNVVEDLLTIYKIKALIEKGKYDPVDEDNWFSTFGHVDEMFENSFERSRERNYNNDRSFNDFNSNRYKKPTYNKRY